MASREETDRTLIAFEMFHDGDGSKEPGEERVPHELRQHIGGIITYVLRRKPGSEIGRQMKEVIMTVLADIRQCERCLDFHSANAKVSPEELAQIRDLACVCRTTNYDSEFLVQMQQFHVIDDPKHEALLALAIAKFNRSGRLIRKYVKEAIGAGASVMELAEVMDIAEAMRITTALAGYVDAASALEECSPERAAEPNAA